MMCPFTQLDKETSALAVIKEFTRRQKLAGLQLKGAVIEKYTKTFLKIFLKKETHRVIHELELFGRQSIKMNCHETLLEKILKIV
jgi:hypothetical protein